MLCFYRLLAAALDLLLLLSSTIAAHALAPHQYHCCSASQATFDCLLKTYRFLTPDFWRETRLSRSPFQEYTDMLAKPTTKVPSGFLIFCSLMFKWLLLDSGCVMQSFVEEGVDRIHSFANMDKLAPSNRLAM